MAQQNITSGIYGLLDQITKELRYIGLSKNIQSRVINHYKIQTCDKYAKTYLHKWLRSLSSRPDFIIIEETTDLIEAEQFYIAYFRSIGMRLVNTTDGGEGVSGYKFSEEQKQKISEKTKEAMKNLSKEKKDNMVKHIKGKPAKNRQGLIDQFGITYSSLTEVSKKLKCSLSLVSLAVKNNKVIKGLNLRKV